MIFADVLCTILFVMGLILIVLGAVLLYIRKLLRWKIWLHRGK
ncbi:MAG: hypothetical protein ACE5IJ_02000 [Thermoplasmata archaeon]